MRKEERGYTMPSYNAKSPGNNFLCVFQENDGTVLVGRYDAVQNIFIVPSMMPGGSYFVNGGDVLRWRPASECL